MYYGNGEKSELKFLFVKKLVRTEKKLKAWAESLIY